jgi:hypothetical protein
MVVRQTATLRVSGTERPGGPVDSLSLSFRFDFFCHSTQNTGIQTISSILNLCISKRRETSQTVAQQADMAAQEFAEMLGIVQARDAYARKWGYELGADALFSMREVISLSAQGRWGGLKRVQFSEDYLFGLQIGNIADQHVVIQVIKRMRLDQKEGLHQLIAVLLNVMWKLC